VNPRDFHLPLFCLYVCTMCVSQSPYVSKKKMRENQKKTTLNFATAGCDDVAAAAAFFYDNPSTEYYYDDDGLLVAVDDGQAGMFCDQIGEEDDDNGNQLMAMTVAEEDIDVEVTPVVLQPKEEPPVLKPVVAIQPVVSGRRKKKRKRRNKRAGSSQPQRVRSALHLKSSTSHRHPTRSFLSLSLSHSLFFSRTSLSVPDAPKNICVLDDMYIRRTAAPSIQTLFYYFLK